MENVKELLRSWQYDLANAYDLLGTDYETLNEEQFSVLEESAMELETAINRDDRIQRQNRIEEDEFNSHLNVQRYTL